MNGCVIGVDPGGTTGIAILHLSTRRWEFAQVTEGLVLPIIKHHILACGTVPNGTLIAVEKFVVGPRAGKSAHAGAGKTARELIGQLRVAAGSQITFAERSASTVKKWATDRRLVAAGVPSLKGMPHAGDGARHALYAAVHDRGLRDPLSRLP